MMSDLRQGDTESKTATKSYARHSYSRAAALKLGAAAGLGLGLLGYDAGVAMAESARTLSGTLSLTWNYAPGPNFKQTQLSALPDPTLCDRTDVRRRRDGPGPAL